MSWQTADDAAADESGGVVDEVDRANMARVYSHWIGGRDTYPIDREVAEAVAKATPLVVAEDNKVLGVIHLKDIVKGGIKQRFAELRQM